MEIGKSNKNLQKQRIAVSIV